jgi:hypothetical protein
MDTLLIELTNSLFGGYKKIDVHPCLLRTDIYSRSSESALAHPQNLRVLQAIIFKKFGLPYSVVIYGDPSG